MGRQIYRIFRLCKQVVTPYHGTIRLFFMISKQIPYIVQIVNIILIYVIFMN